MMAPKQPKPKASPAKSAPSEAARADTAKILLRPSVQAATAIQQWTGASEHTDVYSLATELQTQARAVIGGDLGRAEAMLTAQAHTLETLFNTLARRAHVNMEAGYLSATETYLKLALRAQTQCRATLETLATIKNPPHVAFVRQANIAHGPQQVNNGAPARAEELPNQPSKLLEQSDGEWLEQGTQGASVRADPHMAPVGAIDGTAHGGGKGAR